MTGAGRRVFGAALIGAGLPPPARARGVPAEVEAAWVALGPAARGWVPFVSPAFPTAWPPGPGTALRRYALAYRLRPGLAAGAEIAGPWAVLETHSGPAPHLLPLPGGIAPIGIQGVRPLSGEEASLLGREAEVSALLLSGPDAAGLALIRAFHCGWAGVNGVAAGAIAPRHPEFVAWLGCGPRG